MKNSFGNNLILTIYGESHGDSVGCILDGVPSGIRVDEDNICRLLEMRRPSGNISTPRRETDAFSIRSGVYNGFTTGTPICITIPNSNVRSSDYEKTARLARPSHADYTANVRYNGFQDCRGGGHFSGRITAALVAAGGIILPALNEKDIYIGSHIKRLAGINDRDFLDIKTDIKTLCTNGFPVLDKDVSEKMIEKIELARENGDSVGGVLETVVTGLEAGIGEPWFDTVEGVLSHALFSIPAVKGVEFGAGFAISDMYGSAANDALFTDGERVYTKTNNAGGINGGITNGMDVVFRTAFRPTPTISKEQGTIDYVNLTNETLSSKGRHDPCIVHRARIVVDCVTALVVADMLIGKYGNGYFGL